MCDFIINVKVKDVSTQHFIWKETYILLLIIKNRTQCKIYKAHFQYYTFEIQYKINT